MNAKQELLEILDKVKSRQFTLVCADIAYENDSTWEEDYAYKTIRLPLHYTEEQLNSFYNSLDFNYDNGYGSQHLFGTVWLKYGAWLERWEYDGSEGWELKTCPAIPDYLRENTQSDEQQ